jgi:protein CpxP
MKKSLLWLVAVTFSLVLGQSAFANDKHCGEGMMKKMVEHFKLDSDQKAKVKPILEQLKSTMQTNWAQMRDLRMQMNQQVMSDTMDQSTVDGLIDKKTKLMGDMMKARMNAKHQVYMLLNAKQKAEYQAMAKKMHDKMASKVDECKQQDQDQDQDQE